jgi:hypothetical protein
MSEKGEWIPIDEGYPLQEIFVEVLTANGVGYAQINSLGSWFFDEPSMTANQMACALQIVTHWRVADEREYFIDDPTYKKEGLLNWVRHNRDDRYFCPERKENPLPEENESINSKVCILYSTGDGIKFRSLEETTEDKMARIKRYFKDQWGKK